MLISRPLRTTAAVAALVLALTAFGGSEEESPTGSSDSGGVEATEPAQEAPAESTDGAEDTENESEDSATESEDAAEDPDESDDLAGQEAGTLTITLDGETIAFTPEIVRCNGEPGTIHNAVITMKEDELPLVKVTPGEFAMVKLDHRGEPEKSLSTEAITAEDGAVTFEDAAIGGATVDGTVQCLQGSQG